MMTPVYDVVIADWNTNSCSINNHAARKDLSALLSNSDRTTLITSPVEKNFIPHRFRQLGNNAPHFFHLLSSETDKSFIDGFNTYQSLKNFFSSNMYRCIVAAGKIRP